MDRLIDISHDGIIKIAGVPLCADKKYLKETLSVSNIKENNHAFRIDDFSIGSFKHIILIFGKNNNGEISNIIVAMNGKSKDDCDRLYDYFLEELKSIKKEKEYSTSNCWSIHFSNCLYSIEVNKQYGLGELETDKTNNKLFIFYFSIKGTLLENNDRLLTDRIINIYTGDQSMPRSWLYKLDKHIPYIIKYVLIVLFIILSYLYVLNGRYVAFDDGYYFDKWTQVTHGAVMVEDD